LLHCLVIHEAQIEVPVPRGSVILRVICRGFFSPVKDPQGGFA
jgi:hypothetical protein